MNTSPAFALPFPSLPFSAGRVAADDRRIFETALRTSGCPVRRVDGDFVYRDPAVEARFSFGRAGGHDVMRAFLQVAEWRLRESSIELLNDMSQEGLPVVACGAGRGRQAWEFQWNLCEEQPWRWHAERCMALIDRLKTSLRAA